MNFYWLFEVQGIVNYVFLKALFVKAKIHNNFIFIRSNHLFFIFEKNYNWTRLTRFSTSRTVKRLIYKNFFFATRKHVFFKFFKNTFLFFFLSHSRFFSKHVRLLTVSNLKINKIFFLDIYNRVTGEGFLYLRGLFIIFFIDACITDDEPLWEPLEWSLVQTWIFFIFIFAWIAENLITSRYGSYTGRDKRVWFAWYKTFWLIEMWYLVTYIIVSCFVIVPFYYELTYNVSFIFSWWNWYTKIFFFKFLSIYSVILIISYLFLLNIRWLNWKKIFVLVLMINIFIAYLLYIHFIISFFGYFTDPLWYQKTRLVDHIQLSHEPLKWGWGPSKRDHFSYHNTSTVFWFKNDGPFAGSFLMIHLFLFLSFFFLYLYWLVLLRRIYVTREVSYTFSTYCVSSLRQFFYLFLMLYFFIVLSFLIAYWRFPVEFIWIVNTNSWFLNFILIFKDYIYLMLSTFF